MKKESWQDFVVWDRIVNEKRRRRMNENKNEKRIMDGRSSLGEICKSIKSIVYFVISVFLKIYFETLAKEDEGKDKPLPDLVSARYTRMLVASEPEERDRFQTSIIKLITGNDEI